MRKIVKWEATGEEIRVKQIQGLLNRNGGYSSLAEMYNVARMMRVNGEKEYMGISLKWMVDCVVCGTESCIGGVDCKWKFLGFSIGWENGTGAVVDGHIEYE